MTRVTNHPCLPGPEFLKIRTSSFKIRKVPGKVGPVGHLNGDIPRCEKVGQYVLPPILI